MIDEAFTPRPGKIPPQKHFILTRNVPSAEQGSNADFSDDNG